MSAKSVSDLEQEIIYHQNIIANLEAQKSARRAILNDALNQRPNGIPINWLPAYDERNGVAIVNAWFDPNKYGSNFNSEIKK